MSALEKVLNTMSEHERKDKIFLDCRLVTKRGREYPAHLYFNVKPDKVSTRAKDARKVFRKLLSDKMNKRVGWPGFRGNFIFAGIKEWGPYVRNRTWEETSGRSRLEVRG